MAPSDSEEASQPVAVIVDRAEAARAAHKANDAAASIEVHQRAAHEDHGGGKFCGYDASGSIKSVVFGGLDGIITTFAIVASVAGANLALEVVIITGFAKLLGDGLAMGFGDCMSERAEHQFIRGEHKREEWEMEHFPEGEKSEMVEIYMKKGFSEVEAKRVIHLMTQSKTTHAYFLEHMLIQELGQKLPDEGDSPVKNGGITFAAFMLFGSLPLWPYIVFLLVGWNSNTDQFGICIGITAACLFFLGAIQAKIIRQNWIKQGVLMTINGGLAAGASYLVGWGLMQAVGGSECV